jgi:hypothetical protein
MAVAAKEVTLHSKPIDLLDFSGMAMLITGAAPGIGRAYVSGQVHIAAGAMTARGMFPTDTMAPF